MPNHPIVHIEIPATNTSEAGKFYGDVFGWNIQTDPNFNYVMFSTEGGPGGGFVQPTPASAHNPEYKIDSLLVYIATDDIDATLASIEAHGGKTVLPKQEIPQVGWFAVFRDPSGNHVALYTNMPR
jgi:predicted enzyme related to lactoylglutathione lyase